MSDIERRKRECENYGWQIIKEAGDNPDYEPYVHTNGSYRYLSIYDRRAGTTILSIQAPTYYDLMLAAQAAVNVHHFIERGF